MQPVSASDRSAGLDGLRAFACLFVVVFHMHTVLPMSFGLLDPVINGGDTGVWIFFALSGYLLYKPFLKGPVDLRAYGLKRVARIVPGYYVALFTLLVITGNRLPIEHPLPYLTMSASYDLPLRGFLGNAWTLSAEILFYLTLPLIATLARGREVLVLSALAFASMVAAILQRLSHDESGAWLIGTYPVVLYAFVPGMLLAVLQVRRPQAFARLGAGRYVILGAGFLVFGALTKTIPVAVSTGVGSALIMGWLLQHKLPGAPVLAFAGGASYALYLWHRDTLIAFGILGIPIAMVGAALSWLAVENPILRLAHRRAAGWRRPREGESLRPALIP